MILVWPFPTLQNPRTSLSFEPALRLFEFKAHSPCFIFTVFHRSYSPKVAFYTLTKFFYSLISQILPASFLTTIPIHPYLLLTQPVSSFHIRRPICTMSDTLPMSFCAHLSLALAKALAQGNLWLLAGLSHRKPD